MKTNSKFDPAFDSGQVQIRVDHASTIVLPVDTLSDITVLQHSIRFDDRLMFRFFAFESNRLSSVCTWYRAMPSATVCEWMLCDMICTSHPKRGGVYWHVRYVMIHVIQLIWWPWCASYDDELAMPVCVCTMIWVSSHRLRVLMSICVVVTMQCDVCVFLRPKCVSTFSDGLCVHVRCVCDAIVRAWYDECTDAEFTFWWWLVWCWCCVIVLRSSMDGAVTPSHRDPPSQRYTHTHDESRHIHC